MGWIKIQDSSYLQRMPKEDCMIWITRTMYTGRRWTQRIKHYAGHDIMYDGTIAWMPDQEEQPEPYIGCDVEVVQLVRSTDFYDDYLYDEQVSKTNADRIRSMSDEELAMCMMCPNENGLAEINCDHSDNCNCYGCILRWLRSEVE